MRVPLGEEPSTWVLERNRGSGIAVVHRCSCLGAGDEPDRTQLRPERVMAQVIFNRDATTQAVTRSSIAPRSTLRAQTGQA
jgi:hypothetical protein